MGTQVRLCRMGCGYPAMYQNGMLLLCEQGCAGRGEYYCKSCRLTWTRRVARNGAHGCRWCGHLDEHRIVKFVEQDPVLVVREPPGNAPEWVRKAWLGLPLLTVDGGRQHRMTAGGALDPKALGVTVETYAAACVLKVANPKAAAWWEENLPFHHWRDLVFPQRCFAR